MISHSFLSVKFWVQVFNIVTEYIILFLRVVVNGKGKYISNRGSKIHHLGSAMFTFLNCFFSLHILLVKTREIPICQNRLSKQAVY